MATLNAMVKAVFKKAHDRYGKPVMWVAAPVTDWSLPAGFTYDSEFDVVQSAAGVVLENVMDYVAGGYINIVPIRRTADLEVLIAAGVVPGGSVDVYILSADTETVKAAHSIEIDGDWYDMREVAHGPVGIAPEGNWARVRLERRS